METSLVWRDHELRLRLSWYKKASKSKVVPLPTLLLNDGLPRALKEKKTLSQKSTVIAFQLEWQVVLELEGITLNSKLPMTLPSN